MDLFGLGCGYFWLVGKALGFSPATTGGLMLTGGLANTAFIGLPMIEAFYGSEFLGLGILIDQVGSYLVLSTVGILVASIYSSGQGLDAKAIIRRIVLFVPFQAFLLSLVLMPFAYPAWLEELLKRLGDTLIPLALVSVGYQLRLSAVRGKDNSACDRSSFQAGPRPGIDAFHFCRNFRGRGASDAGYRIRGGDGADDRREHRRHGPRSRPAAHHPDARCRHPAIIFDAAGVVVSAHPRLSPQVCSGNKRKSLSLMLSRYESRTGRFKTGAQGHIKVSGPAAGVNANEAAPIAQLSRSE